LGVFSVLKAVEVDCCMGNITVNWLVEMQDDVASTHSSQDQPGSEAQH
jgi:hypothetical protein